MEVEEYGVCDEWRFNFLSFRKWIYDNGYIDNKSRAEYTIDRINNSKDYSPENCRLATMKEQCSNRRNNVRVSIDGVSHTIKQWSEITGISKTTLYQRYYRGIRGRNLITQKRR